MEVIKIALQKKNPETLYRGRSKWLKVPDDYVPKDGEEVISADEIVKKVPRNGFEITYLAYLFDIFDRLGGQKYKVLKYILQNKSSENTLIITNRELANKAKVSIMTVVEALKVLRNAKLIETRTGAIMINPKIAHRGNEGTERYLLQKFAVFNDEDDKE